MFIMLETVSQRLSFFYVDTWKYQIIANVLLITQSVLENYTKYNIINGF